MAAAIACLALAVVGYRSRDPDSIAYATIAAELSRRPFATWIAPEWWGAWEIHGLFRDHPAGFFIAPALLAKMGYPEMQAAYAVNIAYQIGALLLAVRLARVFVTAPEARLLLWSYQLLPVAFVFRARANHEWALLFWLLVGVYATQQSRRVGSWGALTAVALVSAIAIKGIFGVFVAVACALWLVVADAPTDGRSTAGGTATPASTASSPGERGRAWTGLGIAVVVSVLAVLLYEHAYRTIAGESFLQHYLTRRLEPTGAFDMTAVSMTRIASRIGWYAGRVLWFAFPWSAVVLVWGSYRGWQRVWTPAGRLARMVQSRARCGALFAAGLSSVYVLALSWPATRADRFIFPVYFAVAAIGTVLVFSGSVRGRSLAARLERYSTYGPVILWLTLFLGRVGLSDQLPWIQLR